MIIKGNTVGHPLPDPRKGLVMQGDLDMNGHSLKGVTASQVGARADTWMPTAAQVGAFPISKDMTGDIDLNTLLNSGVYNISFVSKSGLLSYNLPFDSGATYVNLIVVGHSMGTRTTQILMLPFISQSVSYIRHKHDSVWSSWQKIYTSVNKPAAADIGAVTESQVTAMINNALGVIENGTY